MIFKYYLLFLLINFEFCFFRVSEIMACLKISFFTNHPLIIVFVQNHLFISENINHFGGTIRDRVLLFLVLTVVIITR